MPGPDSHPAPGILTPDLFAFSGSVGPAGDNRREDVIEAQILLGNSGHYKIAGKGVPTGWPGGELFRGIRAFQKEKGLQADGLLLLPPGPKGVDENGIGETLTALRGDLGDKLAGYAAPTPQEVDAYYENEARFSGAPDDGDKAESPSGIFLYDENGQAAHPVGVKKPASAWPRDFRSDVDPPQPQWQDGQQIAQVAASPPPQTLQLTPPPIPPTDQSGTPKLSTSPYPHEHPTIKAAALQIDREVNIRLGYAAANMKRWYENGQAFADGFKRHDLPLNEAEQAAFTTLPGSEATPPSRPMSDGDQAATKTPPLAPPTVNTRPQDRPAEEQEPAIEQLIPPETKEWIGTLPPQEQPFAKDFGTLILENHRFGPRGSPRTEEATRIATRVCTEKLAERPLLAGKLWHFAGSYDLQTGEYKKEETVKRPGTSGLDGSVKVDSSFGDEIEGSPYRARLQTVDVKKTGNEHDLVSLSKREGNNYVRLGQNMKEGVSGWARKMKDGETPGQYAEYVSIRCDKMWDDLESQLEAAGVIRR